MSGSWKKFRCSQTELQLKATLTGGQSFRWRQTNQNEETYIGMMANRVWQLKQDDQYLHYRLLGELNEKIDEKIQRIRFKVLPTKVKNVAKFHEQLLRAYFRLETNLEECYCQWSKAHSHFAEMAGKFNAIRVLNQDPVENLFSFICSQNNHISRISSLVEKLCTLYGPKVCEIDGISYHAFPTFEALADPSVEQTLREQSFGYRAKFIQRAASEISQKGGFAWFESVQEMKYKEAHAELVGLTGIGPKVSDCICLMSLNHLEAIPVDTHVLKIATEFYLPRERQIKTVTPKLYTEIGDLFREIYGPLAGWAQTVLFCSDLTKFKDEKVKKECRKSNEVSKVGKAKKKRK